MVIRTETENFALLQARRRRSGETIAGVVTMELTYACNLKCRHCYLGTYTHTNRRAPNELSTEEVCRILDQLFEAGTFLVDFTGGEALCRPDIFEIMEHARQKGLFFGLKTNGTLLTESVADRLKQLGIAGVHFSLYGAKKSTHEFVTQLPGSYERTLRAIKLMIERKIRVHINTTIMKCNVKEHREIEALGKQLGASNNFDPFLLSMVGKPGSAEEIRIDDEDLKTLIRERDWVPDEKQTAESNLESHLICSAGRTRCAISPLGEVFPCTSWRFVLGNLREQSFKDIWLGKTATMIRAITVNDMPTCARCELAKYCARCPGMVDLEGSNGGLSGPSPVNCRVARAIKEVKDASDQEKLSLPRN